ncbi:MAG: iron ABC transporter permease [Geminicoccaceae bacterium]|nr:iron ABC transporter permease [Geminicoccaceae bacterium]MCS7267061.1 iron ABC transporter permease [Geminicoccaceae bacterium]MCX7630584.1 iron ABC transporter permease [Geminicoccaceae bacterium]MDW8125441.1 iron ABC transporter permease [Geminicoccaceae bacterium]MDW8342237.1 iron ABC transporter permease [Geminicoccaceae bacterium]
MAISSRTAQLAPPSRSGLVRPLFEGAPRLLGALALALLIAAPVLVLFVYVGRPDEGLWSHFVRTVLLDHLRDTTLLVAGTTIGTLIIGAGTAWIVTLYRFPGRRILNWALVLPLAMPSYVLAYAWTDLLQVTGPIQTTLRAMTGLGVHDLWFPEIRSLGGAIFVLTLALYPYVYLLARAAFLEQSQCALEVSRTLGCSSGEAFRRVGLPLARPAIAAGLAFVVMETLADFGAVKHFEVATLTTAIYRAWYALGSPVVAAQLALLLVGLVAAVLAIERRARGRARYATGTVHIFRKRREPLQGAKGWAATAFCALPVLLGFVLPAAGLILMALEEQHELSGARLVQLTVNTLQLAAWASLIVVATALLGVHIVGRDRTGPAARLVRLATLGYAVPGAVVGVGLLLFLGWLDRTLDGLLHAVAGRGLPWVLTGSLAAVLYGYLVRFYAIAHNPLDAGMAKVSPALVDVARVLGSRPVRILRRVHLPLLRPSLLTALLLVFVETMKELPATLILRPFDFDTLAIEAYHLASTERLYAAGLPSLVIVVAGLAPVILLCRMLDRRRPNIGRAAAEALTSSHIDRRA